MVQDGPGQDGTILVDLDKFADVWIDSKDRLQPSGTKVQHTSLVVRSLVHTSVSEPVITNKKVSE